MKKILIILIFVLLLPPYARASDGQIYISQIQISGGKNNTNDDFVELFNPNASVVNLKGYRLVKRAANSTADELIKSWTTDAIIPAHGFYLWANSGFTSIAAKPDISNSETLAANNGVALRYGSQNTGVMVDSAAWGSARNGFRNVASGNPGPGQALIRENLYDPNSLFTILPAAPRDSKVVDTSRPLPPRAAGASALAQDQNASASASTLASMASPSPISSLNADNLSEGSPSAKDSYPYTSPKNKLNLKQAIFYGSLVVVCLILLILLLWRYRKLKK